MQRLSQVSLHLSHNACDGVPETKTKVVVTRQLIDEAQRLLDAKKEDLEVVQWQSEKVRVHPKR
jgi:hypothetical protein